MVKHLKLFRVEQIGDVIVVVPEGDGSSFRYQDLHTEANAIRGHLTRPGNKHLIIDLQKMAYFGSEFIGALVSMLRETRNRGGKAMICSANAQMLQVLQNMSLCRLWPYHPTREETLTAIADAVAAAATPDPPPAKDGTATAGAAT